MLDDMPLLAQLAVVLVVGVALGTAYFYALWLTVQRVPTSRHPTVLILVSAVLRLTLLFSALFLVMQGGHWDRLLAAVAGLLIARFALGRILSPAAKPPGPAP